MADKKTGGASGTWEETLHKDFNTPLSLLFADPKKDKFVGFDELGGKIYETPKGKQYSVGKVEAAKSIPEVAKDAYENLPSFDEWRLPTADELKGAAQGVAQEGQ
jgi:hypothetical protein